LRAAGEIGAPVAGIHVTDADENCRTNECTPLLPKSRLMVRHVNRAVQAFERGMSNRVGFGWDTGLMSRRWKRAIHWAIETLSYLKHIEKLPVTFDSLLAMSPLGNLS
jgi:hypothetical protein